MGRFETEVLTADRNLAALSDLSGAWIDRVHDRDAELVVLDMDSSVSPTHGEQEGTAYNGHGCTCYHPLFVFNQFGDLVLHPTAGQRAQRRWLAGGARPGGRAIPPPQDAAIFRGDAAFASPELYEYLESEGLGYAIRLRKQRAQGYIAHLLRRPRGPPLEVRRYYANFSYQARTWSKPRRVVAKVEWHPGEPIPASGS